MFPASLACQENLSGPVEPPDHPLVNQTLRDCLTELCDLEGLKRLLADIASGAVRCVGVESPEPSPLSHELLNANPYAFLDNAPLEERRARAVALPRGLAGRAAALAAQAIAAGAAEVAPVVRDAEELHDALLTLGLLVDLPSDWAAFLPPLRDAQRVLRAVWPGGEGWVAAERAALVAVAVPDVRFQPLPPIVVEPPTDDPDAARATILRGHLDHLGPVTLAALARRLRFSGRWVTAALARLEAEGTVLRGRFLPGEEETWCHRRPLSRIHRMTLGRLRREIEPVTPADLMRFLFRWQHALPAARLTGEGGLRQAVAQLQGFEAAATAWAAAILPARLQRYDPAWLDRLCWSGEVVWGRLGPGTSSAGLTAAAPIALVLREDLGWLLQPVDEAAVVEGLRAPARAVLTALRERGALFPQELEPATGRSPGDVAEGLLELVGVGLVSADGFEPLRRLVRGPDRRRPLGRAAGRWALLRRGVALQPDPERHARQLLRRYGVVFRELLGRETGMPTWRELTACLRSLEARGEIRGGRFVNGFVGEQFALPEAVPAMRATRRAPGDEPLALAATDPLNLVGLTSPGPRIPAVAGNRVRYVGGVPAPAGDG